MPVQHDRLEEHLQLGRTTRATQNRPVQLQFASGLVDNDRKYTGNAPEGVALPGNSGLLGAVEGAQREDFPKMLPTERGQLTRKIKEEARCWTLAGAHHLQAITFLAD
jgi:hypothetical protein